MPKESKSKKGGSRLKFEKIDLDEALKDVAVPPLPAQTTPLPEADSGEQVYDVRMTEVAVQGSVPATLSPAPPADAPTEKIALATVAPHDYVPITALAPDHGDRMREATNGLLKEPGPPPAGIPRVTKEGESSPPMPTELMQLLTA